jgi:hypothetical protein
MAFGLSVAGFLMTFGLGVAGLSVSLHTSSMPVDGGGSITGSGSTASMPPSSSPVLEAWEGVRLIVYDR